MSNRDKAVLITGCSSGIGLNIAKGLQHAGYRVFASARRDEDVDRLQSSGFECVKLDLNYSESIRDAVSTLMNRTNNHLYALVNNGAYGQPGAVEDLSRETLTQQFETNVFGTQELTNFVLPVMRKANKGRIVQISSILGLVCLPYRGAYNASKYALEALSDNLRLELGNTGIKVSLIEPGPIHSDFRVNALKRFRENIEVEKSAHKKLYETVLSRLESTSDAAFTLPESAVTKKVLHALESQRPKIRYYVTVPTHVLGRRVLPDWLMDKVKARNLARSA
ncbi:MAG: SDR family NAD(P)-dependent oxidoreductase [Arenicellales bacterium WSBS_2016_MAG_OTU3]